MQQYAQNIVHWYVYCTLNPQFYESVGMLWGRGEWASSLSMSNHSSITFTHLTPFPFFSFTSNKNNKGSQSIFNNENTHKLSSFCPPRHPSP